MILPLVLIIVDLACPQLGCSIFFPRLFIQISRHSLYQPILRKCILELLILIFISLKIWDRPLFMSCCSLFSSGTSSFPSSCRLGEFLLCQETRCLPTAGIGIQVHPFSSQLFDIITLDIVISLCLAMMTCRKPGGGAIVVLLCLGS